MYQGKFESKRSQPQPAAPTQRRRSGRKGSKLVTAVFYTLYVAMVAAFVGATWYGLNWLHGWLTDYERAQPTVKCQQVFDALFADPDWESLYGMAGIEDSTFVNQETFASYMRSRVGTEKLSYSETSAGLSGDHKYIVRCGGEKIGTFTLTDRSGAQSVTDIPDWQLGTVELRYSCEESVRVETVQGQTVFLNGVPMDDDTIVSRTTIAAELDGYLPEGVSGPKTYIRHAGGMLVQPEVTVQDETGAEVPLSYDAGEGIYRVAVTQPEEIPEPQRTVALKAAETFCLWMIERVNSDAEIGKYFERNTDVFKRIVSMRESRWMQANGGYRFEGETVTDYIPYTQDLCSARVSLSLNVTRKDGTVKEYEFAQTLILSRRDSGWIATEMTNSDLAQVRREVRLRFCDGDAVLSDGFYPPDMDTLTVPLPQAPEGKVFAGWAVERMEDGNSVIEVVFKPDESGRITNGSQLEPMQLQAYYQDAA